MNTLAGSAYLVYLFSYGFWHLGVVDSSSYIYHGIILVSSLSVAIISGLKRAYQPLVLNLIFAFIAILRPYPLTFIRLISQTVLK